MHLYGWWEHDERQRRLSNRLTGQTVVFEFISDLTEAKITYSDPETEFRLYGKLIAVPRRRDKVWRFDYGGQAARSIFSWGRKPSSYPSYGLWRRVDDCICDALLVWRPDGQQLNPQFEIRGGWLNGRWDADWVRKWVNKRAKSVPYEKVDPRMVELPPLAALPPPSWEYVDVARPAESVDVPELERTRKFKVLLPEGVEPKGFEKSMPHLRRRDGNGILLPLSMRGGWGYGESYDRRLMLLYYDAEVVTEFVLLDRFGIGCPIGPAMHRLTFRKAQPDIDLLPVREQVEMTLQSPDGEVQQSIVPSDVASGALWRRLYWALVDGFSCWNPAPGTVLPAGESSVNEMIRVLSLTRVPTAEEAGFDLHSLSLRSLVISYAAPGGVGMRSESAECEFAYANDG